MARGAAMLAALLAAGSGGSARGAETDYLPDNLGWNGLSELSELARGMQLRIELLEELDWSRLPPRSTLLVIYPQVELDPLALGAFLGRGGRVLIADDFGHAGRLLDKLGIHRVEEPPPRAGRHHQGNPNLPVATRGPAGHPLTSGVREVIANHPAAFRSTLPTLLGFEGGEQLAVTASVGQGTLVALSDPSVLINGMLHFEGNLTLATNLLRVLAPLEGNSLYLLTGEFRTAGGAELPGPAAAPEGSVSRFLVEYNAFLAGLNDYALRAPALRAAAFVVGCLTLVALLILLPMPRRDPDGHWLRPRGTLRLDLEEEVRRGAGRAVRAGVVLREELEEILTERLRAPGPVLTIQPGWVVSRVRERWGQPAAELCERLLAALRRLPERSDDLTSERLSRFGAANLATLHELGKALLEKLPAEPSPPGGPQPRPEDKV